MANIRVDVNYTIKDGSEIVFRSPVDCSAITGLVVYYAAENGATVSQEFALSDAHGHNVGDIDHLFAENVVVKVILDVTAGMAYVQNADTNAYIERTFIKTVNGVAPDGNGNVTVNASGGNSGASGLSIFYTKNELDYDPDALISPTVLLDKSNVETHGRAVQVGDLVLFQNGTLATVTGMDTTTGKVTCKAVAKLAASGYVRTVNGVAPDKNGNVQVSGGGSEGGKDGYSIFHYNGDVTISDTTSTVSIAPSDVTDNGRTLQAGDLIISNNGTVCNASAVFGTVIIVRPLFNITDNITSPPQVDSTLTVPGAAADAAATGAKIKALEDAVSAMGSHVLTAAQINAIDGMFRICTFSENPTSAYATFREAFGLPGSEGGGNPPDGVVQTGNVLVITNGVTVSKTDSTLTIT